MKVERLKIKSTMLMGKDKENIYVIMKVERLNGKETM